MTSARPLLSVLVAALNEARTLDVVLDRVLALDIPLEVILVDDGSVDSTWEVMERRADGHRVRAYRMPTNMGKGAAIRCALEHATGDYVIIQDADLEYEPADYHALLEPVITGRAQVVFGARPFSSHSSYSYWYVLGNRWLTTTANVLYNRFLTDMQTCYKLMPREVAMALDLQARGFELDPEITAKLLRLGYRVYEVPIRYVARSREEGKKVTVKDGVHAVGTLLRYRRWHPAPQHLGALASRTTGHDARAEEVPADRSGRAMDLTGQAALMERGARYGATLPPEH